MHQRTVPVALDIRINALRHVTPANFANSVARQHPITETSEVFLEPFKFLCGREVNERKTMVQLCMESNWQIHIIIRSKKALLVKKLQKVRSRVFTRDVSHHRRCVSWILGPSVALV